MTRSKPTKPIPPCVVCGAPSIERPAPKLALCARCIPIAGDIANQKGEAIKLAARTLKAAHKEQEIAA